MCYPVTGGRVREVEGEGKPVASDQVFLDAILEAPADPAPVLVYADFLEERGGPGDEDLAYAFRWMAARGRRPGDRQRPRVRLPWAWWPEDTGPDVLDDFADIRRCPHALLPRLPYLALPRGDYGGHLWGAVRVRLASPTARRVRVRPVPLVGGRSHPVPVGGRRARLPLLNAPVADADSQSGASRLNRACAPFCSCFSAAGLFYFT
jgi:uncharacterized protein (TIGR02996 family)